MSDAPARRRGMNIAVWSRAEIEADDWASLSDQELLERRISKLGLRLEGKALEGTGGGDG